MSRTGILAVTMVLAAAFGVAIFCYMKPISTGALSTTVTAIFAYANESPAFVAGDTYRTDGFVGTRVKKFISGARWTYFYKNRPRVKSIDQDDISVSIGFGNCLDRAL